jgi:hypothetical protein
MTKPSEIEAVVCNMCGLSCALGEKTPLASNYGLIHARVSGGYCSTAGNGDGALDDGTTYVFSLCEFCLDHIFGKFQVPVKVGSYFNSSVEVEDEWIPAQERIKRDAWRQGEQHFFEEKRRHDVARDKVRFRKKVEKK